MSRNLVEEVIEQLNLPIRLVGGVERADAILTLKANLRKHANLRRMAEGYQVPLYTVKANTVAQIANTLQQITGREGNLNDLPHPFEAGTARFLETKTINSLGD